MQRIFDFVIKNISFLLFLLLFGIALALTIQSHAYHRSLFINSANELTGGVYKSFNSIHQYLNLKDENETLSEENRQLRERLFNLKAKDSSYIDTTYAKGHFRVVKAEVYKNSYALVNNYITINKGKNDSIKQDYGVITSKGIVGIIDNTSNNYATVLSILSKKSSINAQLKATNHIGSLKWNGDSSEFIQLKDVSKFAPVKNGDTIITGGESSIFPKGIGIGTVHRFKTDISGDTYSIDVKLFNDMTNLRTVYILNNINKAEIQALEHSIDD
ncbi:MAG: rod shape-determining protein MreC [Winogradskyella sp.]